MFNFRIKFQLPKSYHFENTLNTIDVLRNDTRCITLSAVGANSLNESEKYILEGKNFESEDLVYINGQNARASLLLWGTKQGIGITFLKPRGAVFQSFIDLIRNKYGVRLINEREGLNIYDDSAPTSFVTILADVRCGISTDVFINTFRGIFQNNMILTEKQNLALELYNASYSEQNDRARFLTLVTAIESLIEVPSWSKQAETHINELIKLTKTFELNEKEELTDALVRLKKDSITNSGKVLVKKYLQDNKYDNKASDEFFKFCYDIRSQLLHTGKCEQEIDLSHLVGELKRMTSDLLLKHVGIV